MADETVWHVCAFGEALRGVGVCDRRGHRYEGSFVLGVVRLLEEMGRDVVIWMRRKRSATTSVLPDRY